MELTQKLKLSLTSKLKDSDTYDSPAEEDFKSTDNLKTPKQKKIATFRDNDYSPVYIPCTQEVFDQLDVVWDWNSPQSNKQQLPARKRVHKLSSPKLPIKRHPSNNQTQEYNTLKTQLKAFQNELVDSSRDNDKNITKGKALFGDQVDKEENDDIKDLEHLFGDDSVEEEMIMQSQKFEELTTFKIKNNGCDISPGNVNNKPTKLDLRKVKSDNNICSPSVDTMNKRASSSTNILLPQIFNMKSMNTARNCETTIQDDSFDIAFESFVDEQFEVEIHTHNKEISNESVRKQYSERLKTHQVCSYNEIEQKRLQALEKLRLKKQQGARTTNNHVNKEEINKQQIIYKEESSPIKCSPEEIEQKRLKALAKLEAKKKQEVIERNRREALKRLELNKKRKAMALQNLNNRK